MTDEDIALKSMLDARYDAIHKESFIMDDPINIPHGFSLKEDIEIAGFFAATLAWGYRKTILKNSYSLMAFMDNQPYNFVMNASEKDFSVFHGFRHRTFSSADVVQFIKSLRHIYKNYGGLEQVFSQAVGPEHKNIEQGLINLHQKFFELPHDAHATKHLGNVKKLSACKRLCMFLRWMIRNDDKNIDFGLWKGIRPDQLVCPLDVHVSTQARNLGLLTRSQGDWLAAVELTDHLRIYDPIDPVKYDLVLFSLGLEAKSKP
jgi:uncharacterized protein (TIGR02757 family)